MFKKDKDEDEIILEDFDANKTSISVLLEQARSLGHVDIKNYRNPVAKLYCVELTLKKDNLKVTIHEEDEDLKIALYKAIMKITRITHQKT